MNESDALLRAHGAAILDGLAILLDEAPLSWSDRIRRATEAQAAVKRYLGVIDATTSGEPVYAVSAPPAEGGKLISERAWEIATERERARHPPNSCLITTLSLTDLVKALDERFGRG